MAAVVPLVPAWSVDRPFDYSVPDELRQRTRVGSLVRIPFGGRNVRGIVTAVGTWEPLRELAAILAVPLIHPMAPPPLPSLYDWIADRYIVPRGRAFGRAVPPRVRVTMPPPEPVAPALALTALLSDYDGGLDLVAAVAAGDPGAWCLRPLPGHPRSDLIAELVTAASGGGAVLVAVPELRYGSAVLDGLAASFPSLVRVDSTTDDMDRSIGWVRMAAGHGLAGGGRGVVFAPAPQLRLVVIDEEHDPAYKEDKTLRYDARRVALERARLQGACCVFISPTPSLEIGAAAAEGAVGLVAPAREARRAARSLVEIMAKPQDGGLAPELHARVKDSLRRGVSVAVLAPVRGYARAVWCAACRRSLRCPRCEAGMISELEAERVTCLRCGLVDAPPGSCPSCGSDDFRLLGRGSERYAEQLARSFPRTRVIRMDRVSAEAGPRTWSGAGIYVTTWFGTKPELRPPVGLVVVLDADALTRRADFRAAERAHQALVEMAEWAGPAGEGGRLAVQTDDPGHHAIQAVVRGDYDFFLARELVLRRELSYPPYTELVKVSSSGTKAQETIDAAAAVARDHGAKVLGPIEVASSGGGGAAGRTGPRSLQLLLKCRSAQIVAVGLRDILPGVPRGTRLRIDVDPR